jgi:hypothetical protein
MAAAKTASRRNAPGGFFVYEKRHLFDLYLRCGSNKWRETLDFLGLSTISGTALQ